MLWHYCFVQDLLFCPWQEPFLVSEPSNRSTRFAVFVVLGVSIRYVLLRR